MEKNYNCKGQFEQIKVQHKEPGRFKGDFHYRLRPFLLETLNNSATKCCFQRPLFYFKYFTLLELVYFIKVKLNIPFTS